MNIELHWTCQEMFFFVCVEAFVLWRFCIYFSLGIFQIFTAQHQSCTFRETTHEYRRNSFKCIHHVTWRIWWFLGFKFIIITPTGHLPQVMNMTSHACMSSMHRCFLSYAVAGEVKALFFVLFSDWKADKWPSGKQILEAWQEHTNYCLKMDGAVRLMLKARMGCACMAKI